MKNLETLFFHRILPVVLGISLAFTTGCGGKPARNRGSDMKPIEEIQREHESRWMSLPGVVGVGIGDCEGRPCLKVLISGNQPPKELPKEAGGYEVRTETSGPIQALDSGR